MQSFFKVIMLVHYILFALAKNLLNIYTNSKLLQKWPNVNQIT
jgi:hypothetical protein